MSETPAVSIWLLEDSRLEASVAERALSGEFDVEWFSDGETLIEQLAHRRPRLLLLDAQLPGISGIEVCRFVRGRYDELTMPVLFLTAYESQADVVEVLTAGANDYVRKPYDPAELRARARTLVRLADAQDALSSNFRRAQLAADVGAALTRGASLAAKLQACSEAIVRHLEACLARVWTLAPNSETLELQASAGIEMEGGRQARVALGARGIGRIALDAVPSSTNDAAQDPSIDREWARAERIVAFAGYPLLVEARPVGVLALFAHKPISAAARADVAVIAQTIAIGIDRAHAENERTRLLTSERSARQEAERSNRAKDEFLSVVSHELRTPLNAILGWARMLSQGLVREGRATGMSQRGLETIERNAVAQAQLIDDLLDVSRITTGKLHLDIQQIDMVRIIQSATESVKPAAEGKEQKIEFVLDPRAGVLQGDAGRLQQVVWNLLSNAIKFTAKGGQIAIHLKQLESHVELRIVDTGEGIRPEFMPYVFERFEQQDASAARRHGGLGLGLSISRHIVELHGGRIHAHSAGVGKGATFVVELPTGSMHESVPVHVDETFSSVDPKFECPPELAGLKVLVVDDDQDARELVALILRRCGAEPTTASSPDDAMAAFERVRPSVLISDIGMPGEDGYAFIRRVRALPGSEGGQIPAAVLTAYARAEDRRQALNAGYQIHVTKPVEPAELVAIVASLARIDKATKLTS
jgi:signal transduction histidine kinase/DNA-binding response OmpR family regulator